MPARVSRKTSSPEAQARFVRDRKTSSLETAPTRTPRRGVPADDTCAGKQSKNPLTLLLLHRVGGRAPAEPVGCGWAGTGHPDGRPKPCLLNARPSSGFRRTVRDQARGPGRAKSRSSPTWSSPTSRPAPRPTTRSSTACTSTPPRRARALPTGFVPYSDSKNSVAWEYLSVGPVVSLGDLMLWDRHDETRVRALGLRRAAGPHQRPA